MMIYPVIIPSQMLQPYQVATHFTFTVLKHSNTLCLIHRRLYHQEFRWSLLPYVNSVEVRRLIILHTEYRHNMVDFEYGCRLQTERKDTRDVPPLVTGGLSPIMDMDEEMRDLSGT